MRKCENEKLKMEISFVENAQGYMDYMNPRKVGEHTVEEIKIGRGEM